MEIGADLRMRCGGRLSEVYHGTRNGFTAYLDYLVMTCTAV